jgi:hypothetical protein
VVESSERRFLADQLQKTPNISARLSIRRITGMSHSEPEGQCTIFAVNSKLIGALRTSTKQIYSNFGTQPLKIIIDIVWLCEKAAGRLR